jgi:hypothetical protein
MTARGAPVFAGFRKWLKEWLVVPPQSLQLQQRPR